MLYEKCKTCQYREEYNDKYRKPEYEDHYYGCEKTKPDCMKHDFPDFVARSCATCDNECSYDLGQSGCREVGGPGNTTRRSPEDQKRKQEHSHSECIGCGEYFDKWAPKKVTVTDPLGIVDYENTSFEVVLDGKPEDVEPKIEYKSTFHDTCKKCKHSEPYTGQNYVGGSCIRYKRCGLPGGPLGNLTEFPDFVPKRGDLVKCRGCTKIKDIHDHRGGELVHGSCEISQRVLDVDKERVCGDHTKEEPEIEWVKCRDCTHAKDIKLSSITSEYLCDCEIYREAGKHKIMDTYGMSDTKQKHLLWERDCPGFEEKACKKCKYSYLNTSDKGCHCPDGLLNTYGCHDNRDGPGLWKWEKFEEPKGTLPEPVGEPIPEDPHTCIECGYLDGDMCYHQPDNPYSPPGGHKGIGTGNPVKVFGHTTCTNFKLPAEFNKHQYCSECRYSSQNNGTDKSCTPYMKSIGIDSKLDCKVVWRPVVKPKKEEPVRTCLDCGYLDERMCYRPEKIGISPSTPFRPEISSGCNSHKAPAEFEGAKITGLDKCKACRVSSYNNDTGGACVAEDCISTYRPVVKPKEDKQATIEDIEAIIDPIIKYSGKVPAKFWELNFRNCDEIDLWRAARWRFTKGKEAYGQERDPRPPVDGDRDDDVLSCYFCRKNTVRGSLDCDSCEWRKVMGGLKCTKEGSYWHNLKYDTTVYDTFLTKIDAKIKELENPKAKVKEKNCSLCQHSGYTGKTRDSECYKRWDRNPSTCFEPKPEKVKEPEIVWKWISDCADCDHFDKTHTHGDPILTMDCKEHFTIKTVDGREAWGDNPKEECSYYKPTAPETPTWVWEADNKCDQCKYWTDDGEIGSAGNMCCKYRERSMDGHFIKMPKVNPHQAGYLRGKDCPNYKIAWLWEAPNQCDGCKHYDEDGEIRTRGSGKKYIGCANGLITKCSWIPVDDRDWCKQRGKSCSDYERDWSWEADCGDCVHAKNTRENGNQLVCGKDWYVKSRDTIRWYRHDCPNPEDCGSYEAPKAKINPGIGYCGQCAKNVAGTCRKNGRQVGDGDRANCFIKRIAPVAVDPVSVSAGASTSFRFVATEPMPHLDLPPPAWAYHDDRLDAMQHAFYAMKGKAIPVTKDDVVVGTATIKENGRDVNIEIELDETMANTDGWDRYNNPVATYTYVTSASANTGEEETEMKCKGCGYTDKTRKFEYCPECGRDTKKVGLRQKLKKWKEARKDTKVTKLATTITKMRVERIEIEAKIDIQKVEIDRLKDKVNEQIDRVIELKEEKKGILADRGENYVALKNQIKDKDGDPTFKFLNFSNDGKHGLYKARSFWIPVIVEDGKKTIIDPESLVLFSKADLPDKEED